MTLNFQDIQKYFIPFTLAGIVSGVAHAQYSGEDLERLVGGLKRQELTIGNEAIFKSRVIDFFTQLYTQGSITNAGKRLDKDESKVREALLLGGLNDNQANFIYDNWDDLAFLHTDGKTVVVTGHLKRKLDEEGMDSRRLLYAKEPGSWVTNGLMPLTTDQSELVHTLFYADIDKVRSTYGNLERDLDVEIDMIVNEGNFKREIDIILGSLVYRPFDEEQLRGMINSQFGFESYLLNEFRTAKLEGKVGYGKGRFKITVGGDDSQRVMRFGIVDYDGNETYRGSDNKLPLQQKWDQALGIPGDNELGDLVAKVEKIKGSGLLTTATTVEDDKSLTPEEFLKYLQKQGYDLKRTDEEVDFFVGMSNKMAPYGGVTKWFGNNGLNFRIGGLNGGTKNFDEPLQRSSQGNLRSEKLDHVQESSNLLEFLSGYGYRDPNGFVLDVNLGISRESLNRLLVRDESLYGGDALLSRKRNPPVETNNIRFHPTGQIGLGYVGRRLGVNAFVGHNGLSYHAGGGIVLRK